METFAPPTPIWPDLSTPSCEQVMPGNATGDEPGGKIGSGQADLGEKPQPLQGGADADESEREEETGAEGDGT